MKDLMKLLMVMDIKDDEEIDFLFGSKQYPKTLKEAYKKIFKK